MDVQATYPCTLSRIALCAPDQHYVVGASLFEKSGMGTFDVLTLKLKYAVEVWCKVACIMDDNPSNELYYWWLHFKDNNTSFRHLEYSKFYRDDVTVDWLLKRFWELLEKEANSGEIIVCEGKSLRDPKPDKWLFRQPVIYCDVVIDADNGREGFDRIYHRKNNEKSLPEWTPDTTPRSFRWEEIKGFFVELTLDQLRLVLYKHMHKHSKLDDALFLACEELDIEAIQFCLDKGANINAINEYGDTPLNYAISSQYGHFIKMDEKYTREEEDALREKGMALSRKVVAYLLEHGADIDLYGYDGMQPLCEAYYNGDVELVRFLLEKGANPNYHSYLTDSFWDQNKGISCTPLHCIYDEIDPLKPEQKEIEKLLYQYGGRIYCWGYNPSNWDYEDKYVIWMEPDKRFSLFTDADGVEIGDCQTITVEKQNGETETVDLSSISDVLSAWEKEYRESLGDKTVERTDLYDLGREIAVKEIAPRLPDYVSLYYQREDEPIIAEI